MYRLDPGHALFLKYLEIQDEAEKLSASDQVHFLWLVMKETAYRMGVVKGYINDTKWGREET